MEIVLATKNEGKIIEILDYFKDLKNLRFLTFKDFDNFPDVKESTESFLENATIKAKTISQFTNKLALADDSGLEVFVLGGAPGVISSVYAGSDASDEENRKKLLNELSGYNNLDERKAQFVCYMVLYHPLKQIINITTGICKGVVGFQELGTGGFGYDPIFIPDDFKLKTMAQLSVEQKNKISHRAKALVKMHDFLKVYLKKEES